MNELDTKLKELRDMLKELSDKNTQLEENVELEKESFVKIAEISSDGFWDWDLVSNYEYMSPRFWEIFGYDHKTKEHSPEEWYSLIHPDDLKTAQENLNKHFQSKGIDPYHQEVRYKHKNGTIVWVICRGRVTSWSPTGTPLRMVGTHTDITHLKGDKQNAEW